MGTFTSPITIANVDGSHSREIEAIVDTGAAYATLPSFLLRDIGVDPVIAHRFNLDVEEGVLITNVLNGTPASDAGIEPRDVAINFNGEVLT